MKKCPTCDKTFEDSMRFCQVDGTPLVDDAPAFDPYATIVGAAVKPPSAPAEASKEADTASASEKTDETVGSKPITPPADILDVPEADPLKTMYVSDAEMMATLGKNKPDSEPEVIEVPPIETDDSPKAAADAGSDKAPAPEAPSFSVPDVPAPSVRDPTPPSSPFSPPGLKGESPVPAPPKFEEPKLEEPKFDEAATMIQSSPKSPFEAPPEPAKWTPPPPGSDIDKPFGTPAPAEKKSPFDPVPSAPMAAWTPPPPPEPSWQNKEVGSAVSPAFQPAAGGEGEKMNQTLPIVSLVLGILSICCYISPVTGFIAVVVGFLGLKNIQNEPNLYGGRTLAIVGMILGGIFLIIGLAYWIFILFGGMAMIMDAVQ